jgi:hypothetical protein
VNQPLRQQLNITTIVNPFPDRTLMKRFRESEFTNITAMMEGKNVTIPKQGSKDVCLVWALKGECSAGCRRKEQHIRYSQTTLRSIHELLTKCGVPENQA